MSAVPPHISGLEHYILSEKLEPIIVHAEPGPVLLVHDVITYPLSASLYQIYVNIPLEK